MKILKHIGYTIAGALSIGATIGLVALFFWFSNWVNRNQDAQNAVAVLMIIIFGIIFSYIIGRAIFDADWRENFSYEDAKDENIEDEEWHNING